MKTALLACLLGSSLLGCVSNAPGQVRALPNNPIVTVNAGVIDFGGAARSMYYVLDRKAETCWFGTWDVFVPLDCCVLRRVPEAAAIATWANDATCGGAKATAAAPSTIAAPPTH
jgi:hypothetical protein